ncbi:MAG: hypothetical protein CVV56_02680 [Tenericutes bacterium HGW-Tenericutes-1]|jgi:hypothetical protein|nr:MAG: hypothetical protein CVV56_02680 [Tenericutes bacterium HGW-Tenericutes-1]
MKKSLLLLFLAVFTLVGIATTVQNTVVEAATGKVVYHYQKWYGDYDNVGLWVWGTGTGGSNEGVEVTGTDDFGVYFDVNIGSDATTMGSIPIADEFDDATNRWNHKDTYPGNDGPMNIEFDVTAAAAGATMHVYFFSGSNKVFVASADYSNVFIVYFTATEEYEANLGLHAWGGWYNDANVGQWGVWGTPTPIFTANFLTPEGKEGRIGMANGLVGTEAASANLIVYAGNDATKKTGDVTDAAAGLEAGDVTAIYVAGDVYKGLDKVQQFADASFAFKMIAFNNASYVLSGTYASMKNTILVKFSADVPIAFYDETQTPTVTTYEKYEIVGYNYVPTGEGGITIDDTAYPAYVATDIPSNVAGRVVFHYQKWDSNYASVGLWTWGTGADGTTAPVEKSGVDDFGAVMVINVDDDASDTIGIIPLAKDITTDDRWASRETPDGQEIQFDVTAIKNGTVDEIHVYYFQGGHQTYFVADQTKANVIVLYLNQTNTYEESLGIHNWGWDVNAAGWTEPLPMVDAFKTPDGVPGKGILVTGAVPATGGIIVHAGDTKYSGDANIEGFGTMVAGDVEVIYAGISGETSGSFGYTTNHDDFVMELMVPTEKVAIYDYVEYEELTYPRELIDLAPNFVLTKNGTVVADPFESIDYDNEKDSLTELVLVLNADLDNTATYVLTYDNGKEGLDAQQADLTINMDTTAPVITFIDDDTVTIVAGEGWDDALWPNMRAMDDRDGNVTNRLYVKEGNGTVNVNVPGEYPVILTAFDEWGNETNATFTIVVEAPETGCAARNASIFTIGGIGLLSVGFFLARRKEWL